MEEKESDDVSDVLSDVLISNLGSRQLLKTLLKNLREKQGLKLEEWIEIYQQAEKDISVPLSVFSYKLKPAEALCKYLKENEALSYKEIAKLTARNEKSVWAAYKRANEKKAQQFISKEEKYKLSIQIFRNRSYSLLESIILYLNKTYRLSNPQMAKLLNKSPNSIAVLMKRARKKKRTQNVQAKN